MRYLASVFIGVAFVFSVSFPYSVFAFTAECTGGTITHSGGNTIHTFNSNATLDCTGTGGGNVDYLVVGGGGGGGSNDGGGGGGGGYQAGSGHAISATTYSITVGAGGTGSLYVSPFTKATSGATSTFDTINATGGGHGGGDHVDSSFVGANGGSGGGAGAVAPSSFGTGSQGNNGGTSTASPSYNQGGGGGASAVGANGSASSGGNGGNGTANSISGSSVTYAGGGGGSAETTAAGTGGTGGGGKGELYSVSIATSGTANTGGGGGGSVVLKAGDGGSGVVIISYTTPSSTTITKSIVGLVGAFFFW